MKQALIIGAAIIDGDCHKPPAKVTRVQRGGRAPRRSILGVIRAAAPLQFRYALRHKSIIAAGCAGAWFGGS
jgi:hypothetical protein